MILGFLITLIGGAFVDLPVSQALYLPWDTFWTIITTLGLWLYFVMFFFFGGVLFGHVNQVKERPNIKKATVQINCLFTVVIGTIICVYACTKPDCLGSIFPLEEYGIGLYIALVVFTVLPFFAIGWKVKIPDYDLKTESHIKQVMFMALASFLVVQGSKKLIARPRYRIVAKGAEKFVPGYTPLIRGLDPAAGPSVDDYYSFPSGHAVSVIAFAGFFPLFALVFAKLKGKEKQLGIIGLIVALMVIISRIVLGAHYVSDVSMGALIGLAFMCIAYWKYQTE